MPEGAGGRGLGIPETRILGQAGPRLGMELRGSSPTFLTLRQTLCLAEMPRFLSLNAKSTALNR